MIGRLRGTLLHKQPTEVLIDVGGTGYEAMIPVSTFERLPASGEEVTLISHLHVRDDALQLFAFATRAERELFRVLLTVSGVGPKLAIGILSGMTVDRFKEAVAEGAADRLRAIPGVGKRTADRLIVDLRDRLGLGPAAAQGEATAGALGCSPQTFRDAVATLTALGYTSGAAREATRRALEGLDPDPPIETLVKHSLAQARQ